LRREKIARRLPQQQHICPGRPSDINNTLDVSSTLATAEFPAIPNALSPVYKAAAVAKLGLSKPYKNTLSFILSARARR
jgi:hypothetical protein